MTTYRDALDFLFARTTGAWKLGLERVTAFLDLIGNPHRQLAALHVAGTNGKGSVCAGLEAVLRAQGLDRPDAVIAVWGLAYKPGTASLKNAPSLGLLNSLTACRVRAYDPQARLEAGVFPRVEQAASAQAACDGADALVILTPWPEFTAANLGQVKELMRGRLLVDPFGACPADRVGALGFRHCRLGAVS